MRRVSALACVALAMLIPAMPAGGQSQADVDAARADAQRAERALGAAAAELVSAEFLESSLHASLLGTLEQFERAATELRFTGHENLSILGELDALESEVAGLRHSVNDAAVAAYQSAVLGQPALWVSGSYHGAIVAGEAVDGHIDAVMGMMTDLSERRDALAEIRAQLGASERELRGLRDSLDEAEAKLGEELGIASEIVAAAISQVAVADGEYQAALDRVAREERRLAAVAGVEHWRPLVERYFPVDRVGEAMQVMHCESRGNPDATNSTSDAAGLFQFLETTWAFASVNAGFGGASRYEPEANVAAAAWLVNHSITVGHPRGAWGHWSCQPTPVPGPTEAPEVNPLDP